MVPDNVLMYMSLFLSPSWWYSLESRGLKQIDLEYLSEESDVEMQKLAR